MLISSMFFLIHWQTPSNFSAFAQYVWRFSWFCQWYSLPFSSPIPSYPFTSLLSFSHLLYSVFSYYWLPLSFSRYSLKFRHLLLSNDMTPAASFHLNTRSIFSKLHISTWKMHRFLKLKMLKLALILSLKSQKWRNIKKQTFSLVYFLSGLMSFDFIQEPKNYHSSAFIYSLTIISYSSYMFPSCGPLFTQSNCLVVLSCR